MPMKLSAPTPMDIRTGAWVGGWTYSNWPSTRRLVRSSHGARVIAPNTDAGNSTPPRNSGPIVAEPTLNPTPAGINFRNPKIHNRYQSGFTEGVSGVGGP